MNQRERVFSVFFCMCSLPAIEPHAHTHTHALSSSLLVTRYSIHKKNPQLLLWVPLFLSRTVGFFSHPPSPDSGSVVFSQGHRSFVNTYKRNAFFFFFLLPSSLFLSNRFRALLTFVEMEIFFFQSFYYVDIEYPPGEFVYHSHSSSCGFPRIAIPSPLFSLPFLERSLV